MTADALVLFDVAVMMMICGPWRSLPFSRLMLLMLGLCWGSGALKYRARILFGTVWSESRYFGRGPSSQVSFPQIESLIVRSRLTESVMLSVLIVVYVLILSSVLVVPFWL